MSTLLQSITCWCKAADFLCNGNCQSFLKRIHARSVHVLRGKQSQWAHFVHAHFQSPEFFRPFVVYIDACGLLGGLIGLPIKRYSRTSWIPNPGLDAKRPPTVLTEVRVQEPWKNHRKPKMSRHTWPIILDFPTKMTLESKKWTVWTVWKMFFSQGSFSVLCFYSKALSQPYLITNSSWSLSHSWSQKPCSIWGILIAELLQNVQ